MRQSQFQDFFVSSLEKAPQGSLASLLQLKEEAQISYFMEICPLQDAFRFRSKWIALRASYLILDEKGEVDGAVLNRLIEELRTPFYLGPGRENDPPIFLHLRSALEQLRDNVEIKKILKKFSPPLCHKKAEEIIRETLYPEPVKKLETVHIRRAVLAAWFTRLRQTVGSCFATAPAILIQQNIPLFLLQDLHDLLLTGQLKRVIGGQQYTVPLCPTVESADLRKTLPPLESLPFSPGIAAAFVASGVISHGTPDVPRQIAALLRGLEPPTQVDQIFRQVLLKYLDLTEQDIEDEEYLKTIQMTPLLARHGGVHFQKPSVRAQKVTDWKIRYRKAMEAFCSFADCSLLRAWEYSIASFCDVKLNFTRWNLYVGLGLHPDQKEGIGSFLYNQINKRLQECNSEIQTSAQEYEKMISAARTLEGMIHRSLGDRQQLQSELGGYIQAANMALEIRNRAVRKGDILAELFSRLIQQYDLKLQEYFQEIYDPSIFVSEEAVFDDTPAGFRLVYKHGRADPSLWTQIKTGEEYTNLLRDFFLSIEPEMAAGLDRELFPNLMSDLTTELVQFIQGDSFLQGALYRSNQNPVHQSGHKTPWDYASGGTMQTLMQGYYQREIPFTELQIIPKRAEDLIQFLSKIEADEPLLMHSPTHAFILNPHSIPSDWQERIQQGKNFWKSIRLTEEIQERAAHLLSEKIPSPLQNLFLHLWRKKPICDSLASFRQHLAQSLSQTKDPFGMVDSFLYETFPLDGSHESLNGLKLEAMKRGLFYSEDLEEDLVKKVREMGLAYPAPILFADTNWAGWYFAWIVGPSGEVELWRVNRTGSSGFPMNGWKNWMSVENEAPWIVLTDPRERASKIEGKYSSIKF